MLRQEASVRQRSMPWLRTVFAAPSAFTLIAVAVLAMAAMLLAAGLWFNRSREASALLESIESAALCALAPASPIQSTSQEESMKKAIVAAGMIAIAGAALAYDAASMHEAKELMPEDLTYRDDPAFPKGAQTVVLQGDPKQPGLLVLRVKFPPNYVVPPHTHPGLETVTILSGSMGSGMGQKADLSKGKMLKAGSMLALPAMHAHYVWTGDEETIIQVAAIAPFDLTYINPADDPRKK